MTDNMIELAKRVVACKNWRWMRGMNTTTDDTFIAFSDCDEAYWLAHPDDPCEVEPIAGLLPDLTDPATLGCLLALVREAWGDPFLCAVGDPDTGWRIDAVTAQVQDLHGYASEAEALVASLEAAP